MNISAHTHRTLAIGAALTFALSGTALMPARALAITTQTEAKLTDTQKKVEQTAQAYESATGNVEKLQGQIEENSAKIAEIQEKLPAKREKASRAMRASYKAKQGTNMLMSLILQSESLDDLLTRISYLDQIQSSNARALDELNEAQDELERQQAELEQAREQAESEQQRADEALKQAQELRREAQAKADSEAEAEAAALAAAAEQAQQQSQQQSAASGDTAATTEPAQPATAPDNSVVDWSSDEAAFVSAWAPRLDAYLAGSPLAGYGEAFARTAWKYGVDPRFSPAISCVESSKGAYCFLPHNAWGWGYISYDSWEEAIDSHVAGLAAGYGYTVSVEAAKKYCPPTWYDWYTKVASEMNKI